MRNIDRLHNMVDEASRNGTQVCVEWDGSFYPNGYGTLRKGKKMVIAHREAFIHNYGVIPNIVMHICDNRKCINPNHLKNGTTSLNAIDCINKGRGNRHTKINIPTNTIRWLYYSGMYQKDIAKLLDVNQTAISWRLRQL